MTAVEEAEQAGFDISLMEESMRCTYEQRALQHQQALNLALVLDAAGQELRDRTESSIATSLRSER